MKKAKRQLEEIIIRKGDVGNYKRYERMKIRDNEDNQENIKENGRRLEITRIRTRRTVRK